LKRSSAPRKRRKARIFEEIRIRYGGKTNALKNFGIQLALYMAICS